MGRFLSFTTVLWGRVPLWFTRWMRRPETGWRPRYLSWNHGRGLDWGWCRSGNSKNSSEPLFFQQKLLGSSGQLNGAAVQKHQPYTRTLAAGWEHKGSQWHWQALKRAHWLRIKGLHSCEKVWLCFNAIWCNQDLVVIKVELPGGRGHEAGSGCFGILHIWLIKASSTNKCDWANSSLSCKRACSGVWC